MGISVEFNPDLALRVFGTRGRMDNECLPEKLEKGRSYEFMKSGQRNYWLEGEVPLLETKGRQRLSRPLASIVICEYTHQLFKGKPTTFGFYEVVEVFDPKDPTIQFESYARVGVDGDERR